MSGFVKTLKIKLVKFKTFTVPVLSLMPEARAILLTHWMLKKNWLTGKKH